MKKQRIVILALLVAALLLCSTLVISMAAGSESRATTKYFEVYTADPATGASPVYTETSSNELVTKLQEYLEEKAKQRDEKHTETKEELKGWFEEKFKF